jgi:hypothetical protein
MMSDTPRTDEQLKLEAFFDGIGIVETVEVEFAQQLEAEFADKEKQLAEARAEIERLKKTAEIETILAVTGMYYAAKCNHCGWIGSSEFCVEARAGCADDCEVLCPLCSRHISDDEPSLKDLAEFLNRDVIKIVERKNKLIQQVRKELKKHCDLCRCTFADICGSCETKAALSATERGE